jgi:hypothetical protein
MGKFSWADMNLHMKCKPSWYGIMFGRGHCAHSEILAHPRGVAQIPQRHIMGHVYPPQIP